VGYWVAQFVTVTHGTQNVDFIGRSFALTDKSWTLNGRKFDRRDGGCFDFGVTRCEYGAVFGAALFIRQIVMPWQYPGNNGATLCQAGCGFARGHWSTIQGRRTLSKGAPVLVLGLGCRGISGRRSSGRLL
jgi:hypothetical protein